MKIKQNCRYFMGDRPCIFHKQEGVECGRCPYYDKIDFRILIVKLDSIGDVLRTTCILPGLKEKYPHSQITWITDESCLDLFKYNKFVDIILPYSYEVLLELITNRYDLLINLDSAPKSAKIASLANAKEKLGFGYSSKGYIYPYNYEAKEWFELGISDIRKKKNKKTYQEIALSICKLKTKNYDIIFSLGPEEIKFAEVFKKKYGIKKNDLIIGINVGGGTRWKKKVWTQDNYLAIIKMLLNDPRIKIILFGGENEKSLMESLLRASCSSRVINSGLNNLRHFAALINICYLVVTGDTLAMHLAIALKRKVIVLFGPTSPEEIELYGLGIKIIPDLECLCCYLPDCNRKPNCMEKITPEMVFDKLKKFLQ